MHFSWSIKVSALLLALLVLAVTGCSKLSQENYNKLKMGMTYE